MTLRKVKRKLNESEDFLVFTQDTKDNEVRYGVFQNGTESWEILLNLAVNDYHIRETLRNVINTADHHLASNGDQTEP